jgi:hypothetical protein
MPAPSKVVGGRKTGEIFVGVLIHGVSIAVAFAFAPSFLAC